jgi:hypothetical protein
VFLPQRDARPAVASQPRTRACMTTDSIFAPYTLTCVKEFLLGVRVTQAYPAVTWPVVSVVAKLRGDPGAPELHGRACSSAEMNLSARHWHAWLVLALFGVGPLHARCTQPCHPAQSPPFVVFCRQTCRDRRIQSSNTTCANCGLLGCYSVDCPMPRSSRLRCHACGRVGHLANEPYCPQHEDHELFAILMSALSAT